MSTYVLASKFVVMADGAGLTAYVGARLLADLTEAAGLEPSALAPMRQRDGGKIPAGLP